VCETRKWTTLPDAVVQKIRIVVDLLRPFADFI
jgi:hypothetical protein